MTLRTVLMSGVLLLSGCFFGGPTTTTTAPSYEAPPLQPQSAPEPAASIPAAQNPDIEEAKQALYRAEQNPTVATQLPLDLERARAPLNEAEAIWKREEGALKPGDEEWLHIRHLAYIARQRAAIAEAKARSINALRGQPASSMPDRRSALTQPTVGYLPPLVPATGVPVRPAASRQAPEPYTPPTRQEFAHDFQAVPLAARSPVEVVEVDTPPVEPPKVPTQAPARAVAVAAVTQASTAPAASAPPLIQVYPPPPAQTPVQVVAAAPAAAKTAPAPSKPVTPAPPLIQVYPPPPVPIAAQTSTRTSTPPAQTPLQVAAVAPAKASAPVPARRSVPTTELRPPGPATAAPADMPATLASLDPYSDRRGVVLTIGDEYFVSQGTLLRPNSASLMDNLVQYIATHPGQAVVCEGYSDVSPLGGDPQIFAEGRARSVQAALFERGVELRRVSVVGYGETQGRANKRVDVILRKSGTSPSA